MDSFCKPILEFCIGQISEIWFWSCLDEFVICYLSYRWKK